MGTKNEPGNYDCYQAADPDEPMFILLGRDKHAPTLVWLWATLREINGEAPEKVAEARACALAMIDWAREHGKQTVGLGQATLAGCIELIRAANTAILNAKNIDTGSDVDTLRAFLAATKTEGNIL